MNSNHMLHAPLGRKGWLRALAGAMAAAAITLAGMATATAQQPQTVSGTVVSDVDRAPLAGVTVSVKGTTTGAVTDEKGVFTLRAAEGQTLVFSCIGFATEERVVGRDLTDVRLKESDRYLDEVVVVGYGMQKKKLVTGATVQVKGDDLLRQNTTSPLQALQGQTPGVQIAATSGQPGSGMKVTVRGLGTIGNSGPLYIIDGIEGDVSVLNAADIQSVDILKDAASAAIYGAQAANGVILVTTKQGDRGKAQVSFDAYYGVQNVARKISMLNAEAYKMIMNEQALNSGSAMFSFDDMEGLADTDWIGAMFKKNAQTKNYSLNINGGSEASVYAISLSYTGQEGIVGG